MANKEQTYNLKLTHKELFAIVHELGECYEEAISDGNNFSLMTAMASKYIVIKPESTQKVFDLVRNYGNLNGKLSNANRELYTIVAKAEKVLNKV